MTPLKPGTDASDEPTGLSAITPIFSPAPADDQTVYEAMAPTPAVEPPTVDWTAVNWRRS